eukprot:2559457-Pleurochrysis_carterae.AAC.4
MQNARGQSRPTNVLGWIEGNKKRGHTHANGRPRQTSDGHGAGQSTRASYRQGIDIAAVLSNHKRAAPKSWRKWL